MPRLASALLGLPLVLTALPALADEPSRGAEPKTVEAPTRAAKDEAQVRYGRAVQMYEDGNFNGALAEFRKAYSLISNAALLYNIGQTCAQVQDYVCAVQSFERYLTEGKKVSPARRAEVQQDLRSLRLRVANMAIAVNESDAEVLVDDVPVGKSPLAEPLLVNVGRHHIKVVKSGFIQEKAFVDAVSGEVAQVTVSLRSLGESRPLAEPTPAPEVRAPAAALSVETPTTNPLPTTFWVAAGASGVLAVGAATMGVLALRASSDLEHATYIGSSVPAQATEDRSSVRLLATVADGLTVAAVLAAGASVYLALTRKPSGPATRQVITGWSVDGSGVRARF